MKKIIMGIIAAGAACVVFATDARVETMGGWDHFFLDETSIHKNSANLGLYDKVMYGSYGFIARARDNMSGGNASGAEVDWRPALPHFGGMISFAQKDDSRSKFAVGVTFNRVDSSLNRVMFNIDSLGLRFRNLSKISGNEKVFYLDSLNKPHTEVNYLGNFSAKVWNNEAMKNILVTESRPVDLVGKIDIMAAKTLPSGTTIGLGAYMAFDDSTRNDVDGYHNRFIRGNVGVNTPIGDGINLEAYFALSALTLRGEIANPMPGRSKWHYAADNDIGTTIDVRMFADIASINAAFVPHIQANIFQYGGGEERMVDFNAGIGLNLNIDRGFFWTGLEGFYNKKSLALIEVRTTGTDAGYYFGNKDIIGGRVGFGIERNVLTDWFVIRVGGSKILARESLGEGGKRGSKLIETSDEDHVSLGMGVNIEDRLKIDFTVAQNLPYTFTSLFSSGGNPYIASRVSAVFSF